MNEAAVIVVVPYYLSQGYNIAEYNHYVSDVVVPYYLSQGYNTIKDTERQQQVVVPYYLSQGYNFLSTSCKRSCRCSSLLSLSRV